MYFTHVLWFPDNTIIAWTIENYHEQGNIIITILLLPLGHISNNDMIGSFPRQKFYFYHLPTRGRVGVKLGDADMSPAYL